MGNRRLIIYIYSFSGTKKEYNTSKGESKRDESTNTVTTYTSSLVATIVRVTPYLNGSIFEASSINLI